MKKTGIIGAMEIEVNRLREDMTITRELEKAGMHFCEGLLEETPVVVVVSGIGKVNAAVCTQILIDEFQVEAVINTGIAGSLDAQIDIGDIVVSADLVQHDVDAVNFGYEPGQIPGMSTFSFAADEQMIRLAEKVCREVNPDIHVFCGRIVSGDQFISERAVKERITEQFHGLCTEMEGAAIAQAAYLNQIPFVIIRAISDKADDSASEDYPAFEKKAAMHSIRLVKGILREKGRLGL